MQAPRTASPHLSRITTGAVIPMPDSGSRLVRFLEAVAAAILILALIGGGFFLNRDGNTPGNDRTRLAAVTGMSTPGITATPTSAASAWTDPGHTNAYPAGFNPRTAQPAEPMGESIEGLQQGIVVGDTLVIVSLAPDADPESAPFATAVAGFDLATGKQLWSDHRSIVNAPVAGTDVFFVTQLSPASGDAVDVQLVAISPGTGTSIWTYTLFTLREDETSLTSTKQPFLYPTPITIGNSVYIANALGEITALDVNTGDVQWQTGDAPIANQIGKRGGSLVGDDVYLYVVNSDGNIWKLERDTGRAIDTYTLDTPPANASVVVTSVHLRENMLIVDARNLASDPDSADWLTAISTDSGTVQWSIANTLRNGPIVVTDSIVGFPATAGSDGTPPPASMTESVEAKFFDLQTGTLVSDYGPVPSAFATLTASGPVICIHEESTSISCADFSQTNPALHGIDIGTSPTQQAPPSPILFWHDNAIVLGHDGGPYIIHSGDTAPEATPVAQVTQSPARGGTFGVTSSGAMVLPDYRMPADPQSFVWSHQVSAPVWAMPYEDVIVALGTSDLTAIEATTGNVLWSKSTNDAFRNSTYDTTRNPVLVFSTQNGGIAKPWFEGHTLYYATTTEIVGLDIHTGVETFRANHTIPGNDPTSVTDLRLPYEMSVRNGVAYLLTMTMSTPPARITAIDLHTAETLWTETLGYPDASTPEAGDWQSARYPYQLVVTDDLVLTVERDRTSNQLLALNASDGSIAWETSDVFLTDGIGSPVTTISAIDDRYLIAMNKLYPTGTTDGQPNVDETLSLALYDIENGSQIWTTSEQDADWPKFEVDPSSWGIPGYDDETIYIANTNESQFSIVGLSVDSGQPRLVGTWETDDRASSTAVFSDGSAYLSTAYEVLHLQLETGELTTTPLLGGEPCWSSVLASGETVSCMTNDNLGTYTIQAFGPSADSTPESSPESVSEGFHPDYQTTGDLPVNLRWGPGIRYGVVKTVAPGEPLQYLEESEPTRHPEEDMLADGQAWLKVRTRNGEEGWVREVDIIGNMP